MSAESANRHSNQRVIESALLALIALVLLAATVNDLVRQVHINHRLEADMHTWREVTGHHYINLSVEEDIKHFTTRDVVCGNTEPGAPGEKPQLCLIMTGPVRAKVRQVHGGFYMPPELADTPWHRYACFGSAARHHWCLMKSVPAGYPSTPVMSEGA